VTLFDAYVMVDWSANSTPKRGADSIWIGRGRWVSGRFEIDPSTNPRTRSQASAEVHAVLQELKAQDARVLVGFDFPYGYPRGLASALTHVPGCGGSTPAWKRTWDRLRECVTDDATNANNRFEVAAALNAAIPPGAGPFWGCPPSAAGAFLKSTRGLFPFPLRGGVALESYRHTEKALRSRGRRVQEVWKLFTTGSVGSQALLGIPRVAALRDDASLAPVSTVWPFETGFTSSLGAGRRPFILHAEIWPGIVAIETRPGLIKDAAQVAALVKHFGQLDEAGELGRLFGSPEGLDAQALADCTEEEGWILGA
jgi:hypothetical protein